MRSLLVLLLMNAMVNTVSILDELRKLLNESYYDSRAAERLSEKTEKYDINAAPILLGYKGMAGIMKCKHTYFPVEKWFYFNRGKKFLELAIQKEPYNIELRYFRLTVQTNAPALLGYKSNINQDKQMILSYLYKRNLHSPVDTIIYRNIKEYMITASCCTKQEKQKLNTLR